MIYKLLRPFVVFAVAFAGVLSMVSNAQSTTHYGSQTNIYVDSNVNAEYEGVAADSNGNVYVADTGTNNVYKYTLSGGTYTQTVVANAATNGLKVVVSVAVDSAGNVYISDELNERVLKETLSGGTYTQSVVTDFHGGLIFPAQIAVDTSGVVYVTDPDNNRVLVETPGGGGTYTQTIPFTSAANGLNGPLGVAVDGNRNVYINDANNTRVLKETLSSGTYTQSIVVDDTTFNWLDGVEGIAADAGGDVYIVNANSSGYDAHTMVKATLSGGTYHMGLVGTGFQAPWGVALDPNGNIYVTNFFKYLAKISYPPTSFGTVSVGSPSSVLSIPFTNAAYTQAVSGLALSMDASGEFVNAGTGTCDTNGSHTYVAGDTCTVNVIFTPKFAGARNGIVELVNSSNVMIAEQYITGSGDGPQAAFAGGTVSTLGTSLNSPTGVAVDGNGKVYIADSGANALYVETPSGSSYTQTQPINTGGTTNVAGMAVDAAGNLYYAYAIGSAYYVNQSEPIASIGYQGNPVAESAEGSVLNAPKGVAVDSGGNVYIADTGNNHVVEELYSSGSTYNQPTVWQITVATGLNGPQGVAVDSGGNVYIADTGNNQILKETPTGAGFFTQSVAINTGLSAPGGIAVDDLGNLYISDTGNKRVVKETASGSTYTQSVVLSTGLGNPQGIAIDAGGNIYIADSTNKDIVKVTQATGPSLTFASAAVGSTSSDSPQTVTVANLGTEALIFPIPGVGNNNPTLSSTSFSVNSSGSTACPQLTHSSSTFGVLGANASCTYAISFTPTASGSNSGTLVQTDNNLNVAGSTQTVTLNGTGAATGPAVSFNPSPLAFGSQTINTTSSPSKVVVLTNTGNATLTGIAVSVTGTNAGAFGVNSSACGTTLAAGSSCNILLNFTPTLTGMNSANLSVTDNAAGSPQTDLLTGTGTSSGAPAVNIAPASLAFGTQNINTTSPTQVLLLSNTGTAPLNLTSISVAGTNPTFFSETNNCGASVAAGGSCNITVSFSPTSVQGYSASISVADNASGSPQTAALTGSGVSLQVAQLQFNPLQLAAIAGTGVGTVNDTGDGGSALSATFNSPFGVAQDASGNIYVADQDNNYVRKIDTTGKITAFAGLPNSGPGSFSGDNGQATAANLSQPIGIAIDAAGSVYIADYGNSRIRKVVPSTGVITTFAGVGNGFFSAGPATTVPLPGPEGIAFDAAGNLYVACVNQQIVVKISQAGVSSLFAGVLTNPGPGVPGYNGDNILAYNADLDFPQDVAADQAGNIYIADTSNARIRMVAASTGIITTVAGTGTAGNTGDGGAATSAQINANGIATDLAGDLYIGTGQSIRKVDIHGNISTYAGGGTGTVPGPATNVLLNGTGFSRTDRYGSLIIPSFRAFYGVLSAGPNGVLQFPNQSVGTTSAPLTVTFENTGDSVLNFSQTTYTATGNFAVSGGTCVSATTLAAGATCTLTVTFTPLSAAALTGSISVGSNSAAGTQTISLLGTGITTASPTAGLSPNPLPFPSTTVGLTATALAVTLSNTGTASLTGITPSIAGTNPSDFAITTGTNACGSTLAASATCSIYITFTPASAAGFTATLSVADNASGSPQTVALTGTGIQFVSNVGTALAPQTVTVTIGTAGTPGSIQSLTLGGSNLDFTLGSGGTCSTTTAYTVGQTCTVNVIFTPAYPGQRYGAIELSNSSGIVLGVAPLAGTGKGPQINFMPGSPSTLGSGFDNPIDVALDGSGNIYVADFTNNAVKEIVAAGGYTTVNTLGSGFGEPSGVAVDGGGNVYVADLLNGAVKEIVAVNGSIPASPAINVWGRSLGFNGPAGVTVDGNGNVYVADSFAGVVKEMLAVNGSIPASPTINTLGSFNGPTAVAVDGSGDVFVAESGNSDVKEMLAVNGSIPASPVINTLGSSFYMPQGIAVDAIGDVFVADTGNNAIKEIVAVNGSIPASPTINTLGTLNEFGLPRGVGLDARGNVYVPDYGDNRIVKLDYSDAPGLSFASTGVGSTSTDSPQTVTVENVGNAPLTFPVPTTGNSPTITTNFTLGSTGTCAQLTSSSSAAATLSQGAGCTLLFNFSPTTSGPLTGSSVLADNTLNAIGPSYAKQTISLLGTGTTASAPVAGLSPNPLPFPNTTVATTATALAVTLSNTGTATLTGITPTITGTNPGDFAITTGTGACGTTLAATSTCKIYITFTPASATGFTATLSVADNASGSPQTITLTGTGTAAAAPVAGLSPNPLPFPSTTVGSTATALAVTLSNTGTASLTGITPSITGANPSDFTITTGTNACGSTLAASSTCNIYVTFTPASAAGFTATLSVADNATGSPQTVTITGTGTAPLAPIAALSPNPLPFPSTTVGSTATALAVTLSNTGTASLTGITPSITGANPSDFAITTGTNACGSTLAASSTCNIYITFTPASAAGFTATLSVADNATGSPQTVTLTGTGTAAIIGGTIFTVSSSTPTASIQPGGAAQYNLTIAPLGGVYNNLVTLSATGLPAGATVSFLPPSVTPGSAGAPSVMTIQTSTGLARLVTPDPGRRTPVPLLALLAGVPLLGIAATRRRFRRAGRRWMLLGFAALAILPILALSGCSGGYFGPAPTTYTVTVVGTSGALQESTTISLTVQ